jgi:hypothetical protein
MTELHELLARAAGVSTAFDADAIRRGVRIRRRRRRQLAGTLVAVAAVTVAIGVVILPADDSTRVVAGDPRPGGSPRASEPGNDTVALPPGAPLPSGGTSPCDRSPVPLDAASAVRDFVDALVSPSRPLPSMTEEVASLATSYREANRDARFTGAGYRVLEADLVEACVQTFETDASGLTMTTDGIAIHREDGGAWRVIRWIRSDPERSDETATLDVPFLAPGSACQSPSYVASRVTGPAGGGSAARLSAVAELLSGPAGRSDGSSPIPPDVQLTGTPVLEDGVVTVAIQDTAADLDPCTGRAAVDLIVRTVRMALVGEQVEVLVLNADATVRIEALGQR